MRFAYSPAFKAAHFGEGNWAVSTADRVLPSDIPATGDILRRAEEVLAAFRRRRQQLARAVS